MSVRKGQAMASRRKRLVVDESDDLESFFWVLIVTLLSYRYMLRGMPRSRTAFLLSEFGSVDGWEARNAFLNSLPPEILAPGDLVDRSSGADAPQGLSYLLNSLYELFRKHALPSPPGSQGSRVGFREVESVFDAALSMDSWPEADGARQSLLAPASTKKPKLVPFARGRSDGRQIAARTGPRPLGPPLLQMLDHT